MNGAALVAKPCQVCETLNRTSAFETRPCPGRSYRLVRHDDRLGLNFRAHIDSRIRLSPGATMLLVS
jgi:hypothetical protein